MAIVPRSLCDVCGTDQSVKVVTVVLAGRPPWEADICDLHYEELFGVLSRKGRRASKSNVRPQHKFEKLDENAFSV